MKTKQIESILNELQTGQLDVAAALSAIQRETAAVSDLGFARIDNSRRERCGFPEFIYGAGKTDEQIVSIVKEMRSRNETILVTRINDSVGESLLKEFPQGDFNVLSHTFYLADELHKKNERPVLIVTGGTSDLGVALEAKYTIEACGIYVELLSDVGVAGLHRLLSENDTLQKASVIIAVAGMEGALPSVVGGLVKSPVIAVPTSVGYGAAFGGITPMLAMLNSCASGITVVNIDNGFGAGCAAVRIANQFTAR